MVAESVAYILARVDYSYNDEYYYSTEGVHPELLFYSKDEANKKREKLDIENFIHAVKTGGGSELANYYHEQNKEEIVDFGALHQFASKHAIDYEELSGFADLDEYDFLDKLCTLMLENSKNWKTKDWAEFRKCFNEPIAFYQVVPVKHANG